MTSPMASSPIIPVASLLQAGEAGERIRLVDARCDPVDGSSPGAGRRAWRDGHLPGAIHLDLDRDLSAPGPADAGRHPLPDPAKLARTLAQQGVSAEDRIVVYDAADGSLAAARAWWLLRQLGFRHVGVLDGGVAAWLAHGQSLSTDPVEILPVAVGRTTFLPGGWVDTDEVRQRLDEGRPWLLDARAPARFAGEFEPIDKAAGHIPGAVNLPYGTLLADGRFLPPGVIREQVAAALEGAPLHDCVVMCGSGVTACHLLLGLAHAGVEGARLYPASWSGWSADPSRPRAQGRGA